MRSGAGSTYTKPISLTESASFSSGSGAGKDVWSIMTVAALMNSTKSERPKLHCRLGRHEGSRLRGTHTGIRSKRKIMLLGLPLVLEGHLRGVWGQDWRYE